MKLTKRVLAGHAAAHPRDERLEEVDAPAPAKEVSVREAKAQLSTLLQLAAAGEEIVITSDGEPKAMLVKPRPRASGRPWASLAKFRATQPLQPDSARAIAARRADRH
jgi:prevent-host-death family protein